MLNLLALIIKIPEQRTLVDPLRRDTVRCAWCARNASGQSYYTNLNYCAACGRWQTKTGEQVIMGAEDLSSEHYDARNATVRPC